MNQAQRRLNLEYTNCLKLWTLQELIANLSAELLWFAVLDFEPQAKNTIIVFWNDTPTLHDN
jgi:hypothetical protein